MKKSRTSRRARIAAAAVIAVAVSVLASMGGVGYAARLLHVAHKSPTAAEYPPSKVTICHHTHSQKNPFVTITVSEHALPAHLRHGDTVGACSQQQGATGQAKTKGPKTDRSAHQNRGHQSKKAKAHGHHSGKPSGAESGKAHGNRGHSKGHGNGQSGAHGNGHSQGHGQGQRGQGHDPGGNHGNSGGGQGKGNGKGRGHKP